MRNASIFTHMVSISLINSNVLHYCRLLFMGLVLLNINQKLLFA
ncbi:hypothetical protein BBUCA112A_D0008 (plasmid) [Borreliella burgdorferi CA-11.2A]|nr:hypothetical protein BBU72A_D0010 [Borreliella burgdorferi 72a]ACN56221.1 hypothetical protein BBUCA112A_D0008 [Borreliella burgdorferi CA-11.2A]